MGINFLEELNQKTFFFKHAVDNTDQVVVHQKRIESMLPTSSHLFWATPTFLCHLRHCLVGANMRPPRHMLPKAACPDLGGDRFQDLF